MSPSSFTSSTTYGALQFPKVLVAFGIVQIICGVCLIISDIYSFAFYSSPWALIPSAAASGFWMGTFYIVGGTLGILSGRAASNKPSVTNLRRYLLSSFILSILSIIAAFGLTIYFSVAIASGAIIRYSSSTSFDITGDNNTIDFDGSSSFSLIIIYLGSAETNLAFHLLMMVFSLGQAIVAGINVCKVPANAGTMAVTNVTVSQPAPAVVGVETGYPGAPVYGFNGQPVRFDQLPNLPGNGVVT